MIWRSDYNDLLDKYEAKKDNLKRVHKLLMEAQGERDAWKKRAILAENLLRMKQQGESGVRLEFYRAGESEPVIVEGVAGVMDREDGFVAAIDPEGNTVALFTHTSPIDPGRFDYTGDCIRLYQHGAKEDSDGV